MEVVIERRFRGPVDSGNGGYTCGVLAGLVGNPAEVTLRLPPPLERPLRFADGKLWDGDAIVAEAREARLDLDVPEPVAFEEAHPQPDLESPFPECFVCGHARDDGLRIFAAPVAGRDVVAATWIPHESSPELVWASLDCPGAYATGVTDRRGTVVLGRLTARVDRVPEPGERCVVVGWSLGSDGRKHYAGTALYSGDELLGAGRAIWIEPAARG